MATADSLFTTQHQLYEILHPCHGFHDHGREKLDLKQRSVKYQVKFWRWPCTCKGICYKTKALSQNKRSSTTTNILTFFLWIGVTDLYCSSSASRSKICWTCVFIYLFTMFFEHPWMDVISFRWLVIVKPLKNNLKILCSNIYRGLSLVKAWSIVWILQDGSFLNMFAKKLEIISLFSCF